PGTSPAAPVDPLGEQLFIAVVLLVAGVAAVVWCGAALASWLAGHGGISTGLGSALEAAVRLPQHLGDPRVAWAPPARGKLPGPVLYWASTVLALAAGVVAGYGGWRLFRSPERALDRRRRFGVEAQARLARPADLAPLIIRKPVAGRFVLGRLGRRTLATENRAVTANCRGHRVRRRQGDVGAVALIGPSRSGKTRAAIAGIEGWRGPAILSSVKTDLLAATIQTRAARGEVKVFDPSGVTGLDSASWTPLGRAQTIGGAQSGARALVDASPRGDHDDSAYWRNQAEILLAGLLWLAANTNGRTIADVVDWILGQDRPTDQASGTVAPLVRALADDGDPAVAGPARQVQLWLRGIWEMDPRTSSSIYATARSAIWPWADPGVAGLSTAHQIDLDWLLAGENTLYVCAPLEDQDRLAPVLGGVIGDLVNQAFQRSIRLGRPLDPTLLVVLDEAANTPLRKLPEWASTVAGVGVQLVTVWQSKAQLDFIYGRQADTILTNHLSNLFFAGMSDI
ncbi:MAG TPA: type IV secretory system conjugative DNA transfer family protein, partial [Acidimicrobiia bacterium]|nr:type IV secretory system conjugative DNA transfer family protein [Acidimicrobiia bacterium]